MVREALEKGHPEMPEDDDALSIQLEGKSYAIDDFTLGEIEWIEDELGATLDEINPYSIKSAIRFVTVIRRRDNPKFTVDDARKLKLSLFEPPTEEPTVDKPKAATKRPTKRAAA